MVKRRRFSTSRRSLGIAIIVGLILQFVLPAAGIKGLGWVATLIYLIVGLYLIFG